MDIRDVPIRELLPHDPPMVLLDRAVSYTETELVAEVDICSESVLCGTDGVPGWVGIEYMAQAVAAHAGYQGRLAGEPPRIGYLLGTRSYQSSLAVFPVGATLTVSIEALFVEMGLGAFSCRIELDGVIATATINVYQPADDSVENIDSGRIS
jgi:predicted hotdog family 3-hydroxylacyl-ACP dehydratase